MERSSLKIGLALLAGLLMFGGCAGFYAPDVPTVDDYLPQKRLAARPSPAPAPVSTPAPESEAEAESRGKIPGPPTAAFAEKALEAAPEKGGEALTLEACVRIALAENPLVQASDEGVAAARETVGEAWSPYYPEVGLNAAYRRWKSHIFLPSELAQRISDLPTTVGPVNDWSAKVSGRYVLFDSGRRRSALLAAKARLGASEEDASGVRQDIALNVHRAFYSYASALDSLEVSRTNLKRVGDHLRLAESRKAAGVAVRADVLRARVENADAKLSLVRAESVVRLAKGDLNTAMGLPVELSVEVAENAGEAAPPDGIVLDDAFDSAVHARPELKAALQRIAAARTEIGLAWSGFGPRLTAEGGFGVRDSQFLPGDEDYSMGLSFELPLFTGLSSLHRLERAKREIAGEEARVRRLVQQVRQEVWSAYSKLKEAYESLEAAEVLVSNARESLDLTRQRYEVGVSTMTDLLDSEYALERAEAVRVDSRWSYFISRAEFRRATGRLQTDGEG